MSTKDISLIILTHRKRCQFKQDVLGPMVGCSRSYISKLEKGNILPSVPLANDLEKALKLKSGSLVKIILRIKMKEMALKNQLRKQVLAARFGQTKK